MHIEIEYIIRGNKMIAKYPYSQYDIEDCLDFLRGLLRQGIKFTVTYL